MGFSLPEEHFWDPESLCCTSGALSVLPHPLVARVLHLHLPLSMFTKQHQHSFVNNEAKWTQQKVQHTHSGAFSTQNQNLTPQSVDGRKFWMTVFSCQKQFLQLSVSKQFVVHSEFFRLAHSCKDVRATHLQKLMSVQVAVSTTVNW